MIKLTDLQSLLLTHTAGRASGSLYALPDSVTNEPARVMKAVSQLIRRDLLEEREVADPGRAHRNDGDLRYGVFITVAGLAAIGVTAEGSGSDTAGAMVTAATVAPALPPERQTKAALVLDLLRRERGATLAALAAATGWLPHTTRAALTGLRQKGHAIARERVDGASRYRLASAA